VDPNDPNAQKLNVGSVSTVECGEAICDKLLPVVIDQCLIARPDDNFLPIINSKSEYESFCCGET
jgi:hypothetical protein